MSAVNVLPDWWSFTFIGLQAAALLPLTYQHLSDPLGKFLDVLPKGVDPATDNIRSSLRVNMVGRTNAQTYPIIAILFIGCTLFARNSLRGQPKLQQRLMKLPVYAGLLSDIWLYVMILTAPREILFNRSLWTSSMKGVAFGLPGATLLKLVWLLGVGRTVV